MRPPGHLARPGLGQLLAGGLLGAVMSSARRRESTRTHQVVRCRVLGAGTRADGGNSVTFRDEAAELRTSWRFAVIVGTP